MSKLTISNVHGVCNMIVCDSNQHQSDKASVKCSSKISFIPVGKGMRPTPKVLEKLVTIWRLSTSFLFVRLFSKQAIKSESSETNNIGIAMSLCHGQIDPQGFLVMRNLWHRT